MGRHRASLAAALLGVLLAPSVAAACKCAPRALDAYVAAADVVFLGRVARVDATDREPRERRVRFTLARPPFKGEVGDATELATPLDSATCGVPVAVGEWYLVFASRQPDDAALMFNTCDGTRRFTADARQPEQPFPDVAAPDVLAHLTALSRGYPAPASASPSGQPVLPLPGDPHAELRGLLVLPALDASATPPRPLTLHRAPDVGAAAVAEVTSLEQLATRELADEQRAAVVVAQRDGWYELTLRDGRRGWVAAAAGGAFHPLAALLTNRLNYLTGEWDGWVWPSPGAGYPARATRSGNETPARVVGHETIADTLWLQVEVLDRSPCDGPGERVVHGGWVPAFTPAGKPVAWYYARGC